MSSRASGPGVGQRRLRHEALVRCLRHRTTGRAASATTIRRTRSTPSRGRRLATVEEAAGPATIEAYTVMHGRDGEPEQAITTCLLDDGRRAWGLSDDTASWPRSARASGSAAASTLRHRGERPPHVSDRVPIDPRLRSGPRRRDRDRRRGTPRRAARDHDGRRQRTARATTDNALVMRDLLGVDVPVHSAPSGRCSRPPRHGAASSTAISGLDGADLPAPTRPADGTDAVGFIVETCRRDRGAGSSASAR